MIRLPKQWYTASSEKVTQKGNGCFDYTKKTNRRILKFQYLSGFLKQIFDILRILLPFFYGFTVVTSACHAFVVSFSVAARGGSTSADNLKNFDLSDLQQ